MAVQHPARSKLRSGNSRFSVYVCVDHFHPQTGSYSDDSPRQTPVDDVPSYWLRRFALICLPIVHNARSVR